MCVYMSPVLQTHAFQLKTLLKTFTNYLSFQREIVGRFLRHLFITSFFSDEF